jgi:hypothetical protein
MTLRRGVCYINLIVLKCYSGPVFGVDKDCSNSPWATCWNDDGGGGVTSPPPAIPPVLQPPPPRRIPFSAVAPPLKDQSGGDDAGAGREKVSTTTDAYDIVQRELEDLLNDGDARF